jgi:PAS domain-containing protein
VLVEDIKNRFEKMQKLKHNDIEGLKYYSDFLNDILNDKERAKALRKRLEEIEIIKLNSEEANILNIDINTLSSNNEYQYLIVSAQPKKFGIITNVSLGICVMLGFTRNELIGKALDILIPEIFHREHNEILLEELNEFKKKSIDIIDIAKFKPQFTEIVTYGKNKSRYLVPITIRATLIPTERNDNVFIAQIIQNYAPINNNINPSGNNTIIGIKNDSNLNYDYKTQMITKEFSLNNNNSTNTPNPNNNNNSTTINTSGYNWKFKKDDKIN